MKRHEFIGMVTRDLEAHGIDFRFAPVKNLDKKYAGWFDAANHKLVIARQHKDFFSILLHEYCHFCHWRDDKQGWNKRSREADVFFDWLHTRQPKTGKPLPKKIIYAKKAVQRLEYLCERRAIAMIKKYHLPLDVREYAQKANAYLLSYHLMASYHRWPDKKSVYSAPVRKLMPTHLLPLGKICKASTLTPTMTKKMQACFS